MVWGFVQVASYVLAEPGILREPDRRLGPASYYGGLVLTEPLLPRVGRGEEHRAVIAP